MGGVGNQTWVRIYRARPNRSASRHRLQHDRQRRYEEGSLERDAHHRWDLHLHRGRHKIWAGHLPSPTPWSSHRHWRSPPPPFSRLAPPVPHIASRSQRRGGLTPYRWSVNSTRSRPACHPESETAPIACRGYQRRGDLHLQHRGEGLQLASGNCHPGRDADRDVDAERSGRRGQHGHSITLSWNSVSNALRYNIFRSTTARSAVTPMPSTRQRRVGRISA